MNAAVYARVSTDLQAEKGYSLQTQVDACTQKAKEMGALTVKTYVRNIKNVIKAETHSPKINFLYSPSFI